MTVTARKRHDRPTTQRLRRPRRNRRRPQKRQRTLGFGRGIKSAARRIVPLVTVISALSAAVVVVHFGWEAACTSERLQVKTIELQGNARVLPGEVRAYTQIGVGDSILRADLDAAALRLRRHPWVSRARVLRQLPNRIVVEIEEHQAELVVALGEPYLANADGELFKRVQADDGVVLPVVTGLERDEVADDPEASREQVRRALTLARALERHREQLGLLDELHWDHDLGWTVVTRPTRGGGPLHVHLGADPISRIPRAVRVLEVLAASGRQAHTLWLDGEKHPQRVHVRLRMAATEDREPTLIAKAR